MPAAAPASSGGSGHDDYSTLPTRARRPPPRYASDGAAGSGDDDDAAHASDEAVASLLLGLGAGLPSPKRVKIERPTSHAATASLHALAPVFTCTACGGRVYLRGTRRPSFFCAACPSASRAQRRRQRALHGGVPVSVVEGAALLAAAGCGPQSPLPGGEVKPGPAAPPATPPLNVVATIAAAAAAARRAASAPVPRPAAGLPPPGPSLPRRAASDGGLAAAVGGRCKCGKRVSPDHPPCKSGLTLLFERLAARFGRPDGGEGGAGGDATAPPPPPVMKLDDLAADCGVPRRRLYDILNVLEAVDVAARVGKLSYVWRGCAALPALLDALAVDQVTGAPVDESGRRGGGAAGRAARAAASDSSSSGGGGGGGGSPGAGPAPQSLWALSKKFVRLLLVADAPLALPAAAEALVGGDAARAACGPGELQQALVTAERRLYDVASILCCVGLIEKEAVVPSAAVSGGRTGRAPAFWWAPAWRPRAAAAVAAARRRAATSPRTKSPPSSSGASVADDDGGRRRRGDAKAGSGCGSASIDPPTPPACPGGGASAARPASSDEASPPAAQAAVAAPLAACVGVM